MCEKEKEKIKAWDLVDDELKYMIISEVRSRGGYCVKGIIQWLKDHMYMCDTFMFGTSIYEVLIWITAAIEECLYPLEDYEDCWTECTGDIEDILKRAEELLKKVAPSDISSGFRTEYDDLDLFSLVECRQRLNVFFSTLHMYKGEWDALKKRLDMVLKDSAQNVTYLLGQDDAMKLAAMDDWANFHFPGCDEYETVKWLAKEYLPSYEANKAIAESYGRYVAFLSEKEKDFGKSEALDHLISNAEKMLISCCDLVLSEIDDAVEFDGEDENVYKDDIERFEGILKSLEYGTLKDVVEAISIEHSFADIPF